MKASSSSMTIATHAPPELPTGLVTVFLAASVWDRCGVGFDLGFTRTGADLFTPSFTLTFGCGVTPGFRERMTVGAAAVCGAMYVERRGAVWARAGALVWTTWWRAACWGRGWALRWGWVLAFVAAVVFGAAAGAGAGSGAELVAGVVSVF